MRRRAFLGTVAAAGLGALAGCGGPAGSLTMTVLPDDEALAQRYALDADGLPEELGEFVAATVEDGPQTSEGTQPRFEGERPIEHEGAYYRLEYDILDSRTDVQYVIEIDYDPDGDVAGPTVAYGDLPPADRAAMDGLLPPGEDPPAGEGYDLGRGHRYRQDAESVLVPEPEYEAVSYDGATYPIRVERTREVTVHTYRYTATVVASDAGELAAMARERHLFTLSGLSADERAIVDAAIEGGYDVGQDEDPPPAFDSLVDRFRARPAVRRGDGEGAWLVRYEGTLYWADLWYPTDGGTDTVTPPSVTPPPPAE